MPEICSVHNLFFVQGKHILLRRAHVCKTTTVCKQAKEGLHLAVSALKQAEVLETWVRSTGPQLLAFSQVTSVGASHFAVGAFAVGALLRRRSLY